MEILEKYGIVEPGKDYVWFDCEHFEESEAYIDLIKNLSSVSKSKFLPKNLTVRNEGWTENREHYIVEISFKLTNDNYKIKLLGEEWFDFDLIIQLNQILLKEELKEQFYPVKTGDQSLIIIFVGPSLKEKLAGENILENTDRLILTKPVNFDSLKIK
nr:hypothetical protein [uncultured Chryseobacterium sp.]